MRTLQHLLIRIFLIVVILNLTKGPSFAQGRVVINEYMPWPPTACAASADFVELLNFGPGPVNIGCYILTDGDFSITIPANTILQPGEFYVLSGQDLLAAPCGNIDSSIHTDLNWATCNCTSGTIPTTGDGFLTDGGSANEQLVLLDPNLNLVDAVARSLPVETASLITTSTVGGNCTSQIFDLDLMTINYETIGESAGRGNSFARRLDGDCGWVKDPQQSGNATNNTPGDLSDISYSFYYIKSEACPDDGSIAVTVHATDYGNVFPMSYTLAFDTDGDGVFEITDSYTTGTVANPNTITISHLIPGSYRLTVASVKGCNLKTFPFTILICYGALPVKLISFSAHPYNHTIECYWTTENSEILKNVVIERSADGLQFLTVTVIPLPPAVNSLWNSGYQVSDNGMLFYRLKLETQNGKEFFSPTIKLNLGEFSVGRTWPNPVRTLLFAESFSPVPGLFEYKIFNTSIQMILTGEISLHAGVNSFTIPVHQLQPGTYFLILQSKNNSGQPVYLRFVKM